MGKLGQPQDDEDSKEQLKQEVSCLALGFGFAFGVPVIGGILVFLYLYLFG